MTDHENKKAEYTGERTVYMFDLLREAALRLTEQAETTERGALYPAVMSIVASAFFLEAGLNHIGSELFGDDEWAMLEMKPPAHKLETVARRIDPTAKLDQGSAPYGSFGTIFRLRSIFAHGKTETIARNFRSRGDFVTPDKFLRTTWEQQCTPKHARRFFDDALAMLTDLLHRAGLQGHLYQFSTSEWQSR